MQVRVPTAASTLSSDSVMDKLTPSKKSKWANSQTKKKKTLSMKSAFLPRSSTLIYVRTMRLSWMSQQALSGK